MSKLPFKAVVAELTGRIDRLVTAMGGSGSDLHERAGSIQHQLDEYEFRQLRSVTIVRREIAASPLYKFKGNPQQFAETCEWLIPRLEAHCTRYEQLQREARLLKTAALPAPTATLDPPGSKSRSAIFAGAGVALVCLVLLPFFCVHSVERSEWPSGRTYVEEVTNWPVIVFWAVMLALAAYHGTRFLLRRTHPAVQPGMPPAG